MPEPSAPTPLLWSSFLGLPESTFAGYCFVGTDYIKSEAGLREYVHATGRPIRSGEDGCYVSVVRDGDTVTIGTDASGFHRLFYYAQGDTWCVSDSLADMALHLAKNGVTLCPDLAQLTGFSMGVTISKQLSSFRTMFQEIRLLPSYCDVKVTGNALEVRSRPSEQSAEYENVLHQFTNTWVSRFETLLTSPQLEITSDISGGADSRTILALWLTASRRTGEPLDRLSLFSSTGPRWTADYEVAEDLGRNYGFSLASSPNRRSGNYLTVEEAMHKWRQICLGVYRPIYMPMVWDDLCALSVHGGGGENFRDFFPRGTYDALRSGGHRAVPDTQLGRQWVSDVLEDIDVLSQRHPSLDPMVAHYREFRGRIHSGRRPLYQTNIVPFVSKILERFDMDRAGLDGAQVNFDIMESLVPGLQDYPYDSPKKAPQVHHKERITLVDVDVESNPGRVYLGQEQGLHAPRGEQGIDRSAWLELLAKDLDEAFRHPVLDIVGPAVADDASGILAQARIDGSFTHATTAMNISSMLATDFALRTAGQ